MLNNYRPISILPIVSNVFEKVLYEQLSGRKNEHGQSELALNELNWVTLEQRITQFGASLV